MNIITIKTRFPDGYKVNDIYMNGGIYTRAVGDEIIDEIIMRVMQANQPATYSGVKA